jgi:UDP-glucose 4-epimerase
MGSQHSQRKVLITGGNGFVGRYVSARLMEERSFEIFIIGHRDQTRDSNNFIRADVRNFHEVRILFERLQPDHVIHLAALVGVQGCKQNPQLAFETNVLGTFNVTWASAMERSHLVFASSREVYGETVGIVNEQAALNPKNLYGLTKMLGESIIKGLGSMVGLRYHILRITNTYGQGGQDNVVADLLRMARAGSVRIFGGHQTINLVDVRDIARAICLCLNEAGSSATYNIGSNDTITVRELANMVIRYSGRPIEIVTLPTNDDTQHFVPDLSKAKIDLGFEAEHNLVCTIPELLRALDH